MSCKIERMVEGDHSNPYQSPSELELEVVADSDAELGMFERERSVAVPLLVLSTIALVLSLSGAPTAQFFSSYPWRLNPYVAYISAIMMHLVQWYGARCMFAGQLRALSYVAAILCLIPKLSPLVVLGIPFGFIAIIVLILGDIGIDGKRIPAGLAAKN
ncbi:hypothetical protein [Rhodopirellula bahusiensis]|uniref:hypothetical protein n=1 Tax=Rhodopirellula bahusiensis TaxID=2014065 RepID=UPI003262F465